MRGCVWLNSQTLNVWGCSVSPMSSQPLSSLYGGTSPTSCGVRSLLRSLCGGPVLTIAKLAPGFWAVSLARERHGITQHGRREHKRQLSSAGSLSPVEPCPSTPRAA